MDREWSNPILLDGSTFGRSNRRSHVSRIFARLLIKRSQSINTSSLSTAPSYEPTTLGFIMLCGLWYTTSALSGTSGKAILTAFKYPISLTLIQFFFVALYSSILMEPSIGQKKFSDGRRAITPDVIRKTLPMGAFQVGGHLFSSMATSRIPVSTVHTIKALSPLFTVAAYVVFFGVSYSPRTYISLLPLTLGVMFACTFDLSAASPIGLMCAFGSAIVFVTQNIYFKHIVPAVPTSASAKLDKLNLLFYSSSFAFALTLPLWMYHDMPMLIRSGVSGLPMSYIMTNCSVHFAQNILAFVLLSMTSPVTYSIASLLKRVAVIGFAIVWSNAKLHPVQGFGFALTCAGLWAYHNAKGDVARGERQKIRAELQREAPALPTKYNDMETATFVAEKPPIGVTTGLGKAPTRRMSVTVKSPHEQHAMHSPYPPRIHVHALSFDKKHTPYPSPPASVDMERP